MEAGHLAIIAAITLAFGTVSRRLDRSIISSPMVFMSCGALMSAQALGWLDLGDDHALHLLAELTLVVVLFTDASRIDVRLLFRQSNLPVRLLGIGLPLTILAGGLLALLLFPEFGIWEAALLAAILAPTDAALGQAVVSSPSVPMRIRQSLNVESGLNDGIVLPIVLLFASLAGAESNSTNNWIVYWLMQVTIGPLAGVAVGFVGGRILQYAMAAGWINESFQRLSGITLALLAFGVAELIGGNGFLATFAAGMVLGATSPNICSCVREFAEAEGQLLSLLTFLLFGVLLVVPALIQVGWQGVVYAILSLTLVRMAPVWLSLAGVDLRPLTKLFLGWFGPRGLASLLYALLIVNQGGLPHADAILTVVVVTVVGSVFAHGMSAVPASNAYAARLKPEPGSEMPEHQTCPQFPNRFPTWNHGDTQVPSPPSNT